MSLEHVAEDVAVAIEAVGIAVMVLALLWPVGWAVRSLLRGVRGIELYEEVRRNLGRGILLSLEILVAGDIIRTVAVDPSLESVGVLGLIVVIRTFLSWSLEVEIDGMWPWKRAGRTAGSAGAQHGDG